VVLHQFPPAETIGSRRKTRQVEGVGEILKTLKHSALHEANPGSQPGELPDWVSSGVLRCVERLQLPLQKTFEGRSKQPVVTPLPSV
jgi:hypothetical protein